MIVQVAWYRARPGEADAVVAAMREAAVAARNEPGCLTYQLHQSVDDDHDFVLYEQYVDEDALQAHLETPHFREVVQGRVNPLLESSDWKTYRMVDE
ncbi:MAG: putative quinol monooxygenase [Actinomycetota bacterium]|jgi:(4S)-4-hydroxy-5-phosphonooxypentane-2,3-dione isomerase